MTEMRTEMNAQLSEIQKTISGSMNANAPSFVPNPVTCTPNLQQPGAHCPRQQQFQQSQPAQSIPQYGQQFPQFGQQPVQQLQKIPLYGNQNRPWAAKKKPFKMCHPCTEQQAPRCDHCWKCGQDGHKSEGGKNPLCPKNM